MSKGCCWVDSLVFALLTEDKLLFNKNYGFKIIYKGFVLIFKSRLGTLGGLKNICEIS